jgi:hypothetical protein
VALQSATKLPIVIASAETVIRTRPGVAEEDMVERGIIL